MNKKGTRNTNGEGGIYDVVAKQKRKNFLPKMCKICENCSEKCNRELFEKCEKCENCKEECLKYCDRYYVYERQQAQITVNGKQTTVANEKKKKDAVSKMKEAEAKALTKTYIKKNGVTLLELIKKVNNEKSKDGTIGENTEGRNKYIYNKIENSELNDVPVQKITSEMIQDFLNTYRYLSTSEIDKLYDKINQGIERAIDDKIIYYSDNPIKKVKKPISEKGVKPVEAFEIHEQITLMDYVANTDLKISSKSLYDPITIKNIILLDFLTAMRIGELGAINYETDIDFENCQFEIHHTLTKDKKGKTIMGKYTKTGKHRIKKGKPDVTIVPFDIFDKDLVIAILKEQIEVAKNNPYNKEKLLFCRRDGSYIVAQGVTNIFKRICREAKVKLNLITGCHIHMCRHTAITRMIEAGMSLIVIANIVGHTTTEQIEKTYAHVLNKFRNEQLRLSQQHFAANNIFRLSIKNILSKEA